MADSEAENTPNGAPLARRTLFGMLGAGILLPTPVLLGLLSPAFRADLRGLNRFALCW